MNLGIWNRWLISVSLLCGGVRAGSHGSVFSYQGLLLREGTAPTGTYDLLFLLYDRETGGEPIAPGVTNRNVWVQQGWFTVPVDFGPEAFDGQPRWLAIGVRGEADEAFTLLTPRQRIWPTPYAMVAGRLSGELPAAQVVGALPSGALAGAYTNAVSLVHPGNWLAGSGAGLTDLNASELRSGVVPDERLAANVLRTNQVWWVDVRWFGARGTDTEDDSRALQAALDAARRIGFGTAVYIPGGTYYISTNLWVPWGVNVFGDGADNHNELNPKASRIIQRSTNFNALCFAYIHNQWIADLALWGPVNGAVNVGLSISNGNHTANGEQFFARNVSIRGFGYGYSQSGPSSIRLQNCYIYNQNHANLLLEGLIDSLSVVNCNIGYNRDDRGGSRPIPAIQINGAGLKSLLVENCEIGDVGPVVLGGGGGTITLVNNNVERHSASTNMIVVTASSSVHLIGGRTAVGGNPHAMVLGKGATALYHVSVLPPAPNDWWGHVAPDGSTGTLWFESESPHGTFFSGARYGFWRSRVSTGWVYRAAATVLTYAEPELPVPGLSARGQLAVALAPPGDFGPEGDRVWFYGQFGSPRIERRRLAFTTGEDFGSNTFRHIVANTVELTNRMTLAQRDSIPWSEIPLSTTGPQGRTNWVLVNANGAVFLVMTNTAGEAVVKQIAP